MPTALTDHPIAAEDAMRGVASPDGTTRARIERAALDLFARQGVDGVSIKEIAAAAGLSDGAMYRHFASKDLLARTLFEAIHQRLTDLVLEAATGPFDAAVRNIVRAYCRLADEDPALFVYHLTHMNYFLARYGDAGADPVSAMVALVERAMDEGEIPKRDAEIETAMALGAILQPAQHRMLGRFHFPLSDHADAFADAAVALLRRG